MDSRIPVKLLPLPAEEWSACHLQKEWMRAIFSDASGWSAANGWGGMEKYFPVRLQMM